tara:strand:+ start:946 stop:1356 length:411 start_codon:yes stop_codon:yes gene_type:complete
MEGHEPRSGAANQPFTDVNLRQRVPLVGAQRVDESFAESSDNPHMNRRAQERGAMMQDMSQDKEPMDSFEREEEGIDEHSNLNDFQNQQALEDLLSNLRTQEITNEAGQDIPPVPSPEQMRSTAQRPPPRQSRMMD